MEHSLPSRLIGALPVAAVFSLLACAGPDVSHSPKLADILRPCGIKAGGAQAYRVIEDRAGKGRRTAFRSVIAEKDGLTVHLNLAQPLDRRHALALSRQRRSAIRALYEDVATLYPGEETRTSRCAPGQKPRKHTVEILGKKESVLFADADARKAFGACGELEARYLGAYASLYLRRTRAFIQFTLFAPVTDDPSSSREALTAFLRSLSRVVDSRPPR